MADKDGGNAFPMSWNANEPGQLVAEPGMTLRDYFAAKAMEGLLVRWAVKNEFPSEDYYSLSVMSYRFADAMLADRKAATEGR